MKLVVIAAVGLGLCVGVTAWAEDEPGTAVAAPLEDVVKDKAPPPPEHFTVKVQGADGMSEQEISAAIQQENARREPGAQVAKQKADAEAKQAERVAKICDSIPEKALRDDPSLRKMCQ